MNSKIKTILILTILLIPLTLAYNGYYYLTPSQLLQNQWVVFSLIFLITFAIIFYALGKAMKENTGAAVVVSAGLALFISFALSQRTRFYGYLGQEIGSYALIVGLLILAIFLIKLISGIARGAGLFIALGALWFFVNSIDPYDIFPYKFLTSDFYPVWQFIVSQTFLILLVIIFIILIAISFKNDKVKDFMWPKWEGRFIEHVLLPKRLVKPQKI